MSLTKLAVTDITKLGIFVYEYKVNKSCPNENPIKTCESYVKNQAKYSNGYICYKKHKNSDKIDVLILAHNIETSVIDDFNRVLKRYYDGRTKGWQKGDILIHMSEPIKKIYIPK